MIHFFKNKLKKIDVSLLVGLLLVSIYGIILVISASNSNSHLVYSKIIQVIIGFSVFFTLALIPTRFYEKIAPLLYIISIVLLLLVDITGDISKGAQRWLNLGFIRFQPSEITKFATPLMIAYYLGNRPLPPSLKDSFIALTLIIVPTLLVLVQPDLGTAVLVFSSGFLALYLAGLMWKVIGFGAISAAILAPVMWLFTMHDYQKQRVLTFLNPESDPLGSGYHIIQSKIAIGSGGFYGKGYFLGTQSQLEFLPEPHTDFIFAVLGEELGLVGILMLLFLYFIIITRCIFIGANANTNFGRIISGTTGFLFFIYIFVNIGMVSGIMPVVGVPLPLVSYGGSSFVTLMATFGIVMSVKIHQNLNKQKSPYH